MSSPALFAGLHQDRITILSLKIPFATSSVLCATSGFSDRLSPWCWILSMVCRKMVPSTPFSSWLIRKFRIPSGSRYEHLSCLFYTTFLF
jgi:hypothetical protein